MSARRSRHRSPRAWVSSRTLVILMVLAVATTACGSESNPVGEEAATTGTTASTDSDDSTTATGTAASTDSSESATTTSTTTSLESDESATTTDAVSEGSGDSSGASGSGQCMLEISGDQQETLTFQQDPSSVSTDYWLSEETLRSIADELGEFAGGTYEELVGRGEPILNILQISCGLNLTSSDSGAFIVASEATRTTDLPMGPGSYPISGGLSDDESPAATMGASVTFENDPYTTLPNSGSVEITRWDNQEIAGSYSFTAQELFVDNPKEINVGVTFSFRCDHVVGANC